MTFFSFSKACICKHSLFQCLEASHGNVAFACDIFATGIQIKPFVREAVQLLKVLASPLTDGERYYMQSSGFGMRRPQSARRWLP